MTQNAMTTMDLDRIMIPEGTQLHKVWMEVKDEIKSLTAVHASIKAQRDQLWDEAKTLRGKLASAESNGKENAKLAELFRSHLDDSANDMECDNEWEQEARHMIWNEVDNAASRDIHCMADAIHEAAVDMRQAEGIEE